MKIEKIFKKRSIVNLTKKLFLKLYTFFAYLKFKRRRMHDVENKQKVIVSLSLDSKLFQILYQFTNCGYICYLDIPFRQFMKFENYELKAISLNNVFHLPEKYNKTQLIVVSDNKEYLDKFDTERLKIFVSRFVFKNLKNITRDDFFYPLLSHYNFLSFSSESDILLKSSRAERKICAVFIGNANINSYKNELTKELFNINTRNESFYYILKKLPENILYIPETLDSFLNDIETEKLKNRVVLLDTKRFNLPVDIYTAVLLNSEFFIHMCGVVQPYCHNQIESMMTGCIPITQFASFFRPPFQHEENGLLFNNLDELIELLISVASGKYEEKIPSMRKSILNYYSQHFSLLAFKNELSELLDKKIEHANYYLGPSKRCVLNEPHLHKM